MKNNLITNVLVFIAGTAVGSAVTYKLLKNKFEQIAQEEIDSMKIALGRTAGMELGDCDDSEEEDDEYIEEESTRCEEYREAVLSGNPLAQKPDLKEYAKKVSNYSSYSESPKKEEVEEDMAEMAPYIIKPDEYGDLDGYDTGNLLYHSDGVLIDMMDRSIVENAEFVVGTEFQDHFGEDEEDTVYVRNDSLKCDYEILKDYDPYYSEEE